MNNPYMQILLECKQMYTIDNGTEPGYVHVDKDMYNNIRQFYHDYRLGMAQTLTMVYGLKIIMHPEMEFCTCIVSDKELI